MDLYQDVPPKKEQGKQGQEGSQKTTKHRWRCLCVRVCRTSLAMPSLMRSTKDSLRGRATLNAFAVSFDTEVREWILRGPAMSEKVLGAEDTAAAALAPCDPRPPPWQDEPLRSERGGSRSVERKE